MDARYDLFDIESIELVEKVFKKPGLGGFNVTIPYKEAIKPYLHEFDESAVKVGAVNVVKITDEGTRIGFNSDYYGFRRSLLDWLGNTDNIKALVLGTGGAAKAVVAVLGGLGIDFQVVSRNSAKGDLTYEALKNALDILSISRLVINTTPLGMSPNLDACPDLPYEHLDSGHFLYDLVYNPPETVFLKRGLEKGCQTKNGLEMLELQAEKSWEIWNG